MKFDYDNNNNNNNNNNNDYNNVSRRVKIKYETSINYNIPRYLFPGNWFNKCKFM